MVMFIFAMTEHVILKSASTSGFGGLFLKLICV